MKPKLLTTIRDYSWRAFISDALAGITVAMVALPLSIAIAIASGADPKSGLVTAIVAGFLVSLLGGSRVQIGGPTGAFIVVVYGVIAQHGLDGLMLATLMAGIILAIGGILRAGRFIALVPEAVIEGFTIGIALIIAVSQLKDLLGLSAAKVPADLIEAVPALWAARDGVNPAALTIGLLSIAVMSLLRRTAPWFPGSLLVIAAAAARSGEVPELARIFAMIEVCGGAGSHPRIFLALRTQPNAPCGPAADTALMSALRPLRPLKTT